MRKITLIAFSALLITGCNAPTITQSANTEDVFFQIQDNILQRNVGEGWEDITNARAVSAENGIVYIADGHDALESEDLGETWRTIFSASDPVTDIESFQGYVWLSVASWGSRSGIHRRNPEGAWEHLLWENCQAIDVEDIDSATTIIKEGGYNYYWVYQTAPGNPYLWIKLYSTSSPAYQ